MLDEKADFIVPVPSVEKRIKQRGFDHTLKLAKSFSNLTSIKMDNKILKRVSEIKPQIESHRAERIKNIKQVFKAEKINGQNIILIDDVITTGATLNECAKALKDGGANKVYAVTVAATKYKIVFETSSEMSEAANIFAD